MYPGLDADQCPHASSVRGSSCEQNFGPTVEPRDDRTTSPPSCSCKSRAVGTFLTRAKKTAKTRQYTVMGYPIASDLSPSRQRRSNLVPHRHDQDRGPRPRRGRGGLPPARPARAGPRHGPALQRPGHRPARPAARLALPGRHRHGHRPGPLRQLRRRAGATQKHLDRFLQAYAVERARIEARKRGHHVPSSPWPTARSWSRSRWEVPHEEDHRDHRRPQGRDQGRDQGLLRRRVPRGQPVHRAGPRPAGRPRQLTAEFYQAQPADQQIKQSQ